MSKKFADVWDDVEEALDTTKAIAFEGCHKIYMLLDDQQVEQMRGYGYGEDGSFLITNKEMNKAEMFSLLKTWYEKSCGLKFIESVETNEEDPNLGFTNIIPQGYEGEFCSECGDYGVDFDQLCDECREEYDDYDSYADEDEEEEED